MITIECLEGIMKQFFYVGDELYLYILKKIVENPWRYVGGFKSLSFRDKIRQNALQSRNIKYGDFFEKIIYEYIGSIGGINYSRELEFNEETLKCDQLFKLDGQVFLIEQKMRDDHDSTKKKSQYENFKKKAVKLKNSLDANIGTFNAIMWFVDSKFAKNKAFYDEEIRRLSNELGDGCNVKLMYGKELFSEIFNRISDWNEIIEFLSNIPYRLGEFSYNGDWSIAVRLLNERHRNLFKKLNSENETYILIKNELFPGISDLRTLLC